MFKKTRKPILLFLIMVLFAVMLASCTQSEPASDEPEEPAVAEPEQPVAEPEQPEATEPPPTEAPEPTAPPVEQKLTIAVNQIGEALDTTIASKETSWRQEFLIYDPIVSMGTDGNPHPALATSWQALDDTTWEFKLREGVQFHNGEEFNAEAIKFTIEFQLNPETNSNYARNLTMIKEVKIIDDYTVHLITDGPQAVLVANLAGVLILPPKYFAEVGREAFNAAPVGTGPYKIVEYALDEKVVLERNTEYWGDPYQIDTVVFLEMPEVSTRVAALEAGEVDIIDQITIDQAQRLEGTGLLVEAVTETTTLVFLLESPVQREEYPFLSDPRVRQALNYAVNKQEIVDALTGGYGRPSMGTLVGPDGFGYDPDFSMYEYDPEKARQLLADAGYADGFTFTMYYPVDRYAYGDDIPPIMAGYLAEIGVTMEMEAMENAAWVEKYLAVELPTSLFSPNYDPTMDADRVLFMCYSEFPRKWVEANPEFDALFEQQRGLLDAEERLPVLQAAGRKCAEMAPVIFTMFPPSIYAYNPRVKDIHFRSDARFDLHGVSIEG